MNQTRLTRPLLLPAVLSSAALACAQNTNVWPRPATRQNWLRFDL
jgi:hypothetical protein